METIFLIKGQVDEKVQTNVHTPSLFLDLYQNFFLALDALCFRQGCIKSVKNPFHSLLIAMYLWQMSGYDNHKRHKRWEFYFIIYEQTNVNMKEQNSPFPSLTVDAQ